MDNKNTTNNILPADTLSKLLLNNDRDSLASFIETNIKRKSSTEAQQIAQDLLKNSNLFQALVTYIQRENAGTVDDPVCVWFYEWYQMEDPKDSEPYVKRFVLQFVPIFVWVYIYNVQSFKRNLVGIEALLLSIYNKELIRRDNKEIKWIPPTISSIRGGKKTGASPALLTEKALKGFDVDSEDNGSVIEDVLPIISESIGAKERELLVKVALQQYLANMSFFPDYSIYNFCLVAVKICASGFPFDVASLGEGKEEKNYNLSLAITKAIRIHVSTTILNYVLFGITFAVFHAHTTQAGVVALNAMASRASYDLIPEILMQTNALKHILETEK